MNTPTLAPDTLKQLALIRLHYEEGTRQAKRPEPLNYAAVLTFHDAVELVLVLAGQHLGGSLPKEVRFLEYWPKIKALPAGVELSGLAGMDRLNRVRNAFKHVGGVPSPAQVDQAKSDVTSFFEDITPRVFGIPFDQIDMMKLISQQNAREMVEKAHVCAEGGDYLEALALLSEAFDWLLDDYASRKRSGYDETPFTFGRSLGELESSARHLRLGYPSNPAANLVGNAVEAVVRELKPMQQRLTILSTGLDYRRYARFSMLVPVVRRVMDRSRSRVVFPRSGVTPDHYSFCKAFVVYAALHLAAEDFDLDLMTNDAEGG